MGVDVIWVYIVKLVFIVHLTDILNTDGRQLVVPP